jgi:Tol biopolymer transport system component
VRRLGLVAVLALLLPAQAQAAFPGTNGKIAFDEDQGGHSGIWTMNPDGTGAGSLVDGFFNPKSSPDGARLLTTNSSDVWVLNADGTGATRLTTDPGVDTDPSWSPNGSKVVFSTNRDGNYEIYAMNADGTSQMRLTNNSAADRHPAWSPAGTKVAFNRDTQINVMNPDGSGQAQVPIAEHNCYLRGPSDKGKPEWSPSGDRIVFDWNAGLDCDFEEDGYAGIDTIRADGTDQRQLWYGYNIQPYTWPVNPAYSPDGTKIAFVMDMWDIYMMSSTGAGQTFVHPTLNGDLDAVDWQPLPVNTASAFARPKGATPFRASLVPAFQACTSSNRTHGAPLAFPSCTPPAPGSSSLTVGVGDGSPALSKSIGSMRMDVMPTDVNLRMSLTNVMNASDLSDYTGALHASMSSRLTDKEGTVASTRIDFPFAFDVPCTATADTTLGGDCRIVTSFNSVLPGAATAGLRTNWETGRFEVYDGTGALLATQGVFVP